jgi:hypothetical protein
MPFFDTDQLTGREGRITSFMITLYKCLVVIASDNFREICLNGLYNRMVIAMKFPSDNMEEN